MMFFADKTHVAFGDFKDDMRCSTWEVLPYVVHYKEQYWLMWQSEILYDDKKGTRKAWAMLMNKHGVFFHGQFDFETMSMEKFIPSIKNKLLCQTATDTTETRFQLGLVRRAMEYHGWNVEQMFKRMQYAGVMYITRCASINDLKKRLENTNENDVNFTIN